MTEQEWREWMEQTRAAKAAGRLREVGVAEVKTDRVVDEEGSEAVGDEFELERYPFYLYASI